MRGSQSSASWKSKRVNPRLQRRVREMRARANIMRALRARLLEQLSAAEVEALDYAADACDQGADILQGL